MEISVNKLIKANPYELSKLAFALNPSAVQEAFARVGLLVEDEVDLKHLSAIHEEGNDVKGKIKNKKGEPILFDFQDVLANIEMSQGDYESVKKLNLIWE